MSRWIKLQTQEDVDILMNRFGGFRDACLMKLHYKSGAWKEDDFIYFGPEMGRELHMVFDSKWGKRLELCFIGVRRFSVAGWQEDFCCDIFDCHFAFHTGLLRNEEVPLLVWADDEMFDPTEWDNLGYLDEPMVSVVFADEAKWRFLD